MQPTIPPVAEAGQNGAELVELVPGSSGEPQKACSSSSGLNTDPASVRDIVNDPKIPGLRTTESCNPHWDEGQAALHVLTSHPGTTLAARPIGGLVC